MKEVILTSEEINRANSIPPSQRDYTTVIDYPKSEMTLADYVAIQVLPKSSAYVPRSLWQAFRWAFGRPFESLQVNRAEACREAYDYAVAFLKEREKRRSPYVPPQPFNL